MSNYTVTVTMEVFVNAPDAETAWYRAEEAAFRGYAAADQYQHTTFVRYTVWGPNTEFAPKLTDDIGDED